MNRFCEKCGTELIDEVCPKCIQNESDIVKENVDKYKQFVASPNEKVVAVLGHSYIEKFLKKGSIKEGFAVASDKRVYFQGNHYYIGYNARGKIKANKNCELRTVDIKDITGIGTYNYSNNIWKILKIISIVSGIIFILISILVSFVLTFEMSSFAQQMGGWY